MKKYPDAIILKCRVCQATFSYLRDGRSLQYYLPDCIKSVCGCFQPQLLTGGLVGSLKINRRTVVLTQKNVE